MRAALTNRKQTEPLELLAQVVVHEGHQLEKGFGALRELGGLFLLYRVEALLLVGFCVGHGGFDLWRVVGGVGVVGWLVIVGCWLLLAGLVY